MSKKEFCIICEKNIEEKYPKELLCGPVCDSCIKKNGYKECEECGMYIEECCDINLYKGKYYHRDMYNPKDKTSCYYDAKRKFKKK